MPRFCEALARGTVSCLLGIALLSGCTQTGDTPNTATDPTGSPEQGVAHVLELTSSAFPDGEGHVLASSTITCYFGR